MTIIGRGGSLDPPAISDTCKDARTGRASECGIALIVALLMLSILSAIGLGLSLVVSVDPMAAANQREATSALYIARAGLELAAHELATASSWDAWLSGAATSTFVDGASSGTRTLPTGESIDIGRLTNRLTCGREVTCTDAEVAANTRERPWGANNPRWRPFLYGSTPSLGLGAASEQHYLIAWIGDDSAERDGRPESDGNDAAGGGVVRVIVQAFGPFRSRQAIEAQLSRRCETTAGARVCVPSLRVQALRLRGG